jgi:hypothetical protein
VGASFVGGATGIGIQNRRRRRRCRLRADQGAARAPVKEAHISQIMPNSTSPPGWQGATCCSHERSWPAGVEGLLEQAPFEFDDWIFLGEDISFPLSTTKLVRRGWANRSKVTVSCGIYGRKYFVISRDSSLGELCAGRSEGGTRTFAAT